MENSENSYYVKPSSRRSIHNTENRLQTSISTPAQHDDQSDETQSSREEEESYANESENLLFEPEEPTTNAYTSNHVTHRKVKHDLEKSRSVPGTPERPARESRMHDRIADTEVHTNEPDLYITKSSEGYRSKIIFATICAICVIGLIYMRINSVEENTHRFCSFDELRKIYPKQREYLWRSLRIGIENILNKKTPTPGVYLFVYPDGGQIQNLVQDIVKKSSSCFGQDMKYIELNAKDFTAAADYGIIIENYKQKILNGNVVLVANLNEIPALAARALHSICDTHSPVKEDVIIFLTLNAPAINGNVIGIAQDLLHDMWSTDLEYNELAPLITRVTDQVIELKI